ncbi:MAG: dTDP-glucose 4,6-dehydratase [Kofleriaceae bacterium]|nr:dTDP-glucose 4,6-dehydratase [Kofleriaceae bacterium]
MMRILVTGGAGFIGSTLLNTLVPRHPEHQFLNVDVLTYAANPANLAVIEGRENYEFEQVDITDEAGVRSVFDKWRPNCVIHLAAESHVDRSIHGPRAFMLTNILGTFNLLEAARATWTEGEGLFHHVSTDEVYGSLADGEFFSEDSPYDPSSPYSASKASSDHLVRSHGRTYNMPIRISNCSNNYGPMQFPEKLIPLMIGNLLKRRPLPVYGRGLNVRDWLHVSDHCEAIWAIVQHGTNGESYNVGGNCPMRNIDVVYTLCALVAEATGTDEDELRSLVCFVEDRPGHDLRYAVDASKIAQELGVVPSRDFSDGLRSTVQWYLQNQEWVQAVTDGSYRDWIEQNYSSRATATISKDTSKNGPTP